MYMTLSPFSRSTEAVLKDATETPLLHRVFGKLHKHHGYLVTTNDE